METIPTNPLMPTATDRTQARGTQFTPVFTAIGEFFASTRKSMSMPVKFADKTGIPDWNMADKAYADITYSRADMRTIMTTLIGTCHKHCSGTFGKDIADWEAFSYKDLASALSLTYTVTKGDNKDTVRNHIAHFQASARSTMKYATAAQDLQETVDNGDAWSAEGHVDKQGNIKPCKDEKAARKAWARLECNYGADWWVLKDSKEARLAEAVVFKYNPDGAINMDTIRSMSHVQVRTLAKKAGAPDSITTGKGAKARSINWFSEDASRISAAQV